MSQAILYKFYMFHCFSV